MLTAPAAAQTGTVPAAIASIFYRSPAEQAFAARITSATMTGVYREDPLIPAIAAAGVATAAHVDERFAGWRGYDPVARPKFRLGVGVAVVQRGIIGFDGQIGLEALRLYGLPEAAPAVLNNTPAIPNAGRRSFSLDTDVDLPNLAPGAERPFDVTLTGARPAISGAPRSPPRAASCRSRAMSGATTPSASSRATSRASASICRAPHWRWR